MALLSRVQLPGALMVDCSHGNSEKHPERQALVLEDLIAQMREGQSAIRGVMIESHLKAGRQNFESSESLVYGQSITDACLSIEDTTALLRHLAENL